MLVVKRLGRLTGCVKFPPFCQLEDFVSRLCQASEMEHCPRIGGEVELGVLCTRVCFQERARRKDAESPNQSLLLHFFPFYFPPPPADSKAQISQSRTHPHQTATLKHFTFVTNTHLSLKKETRKFQQKRVTTFQHDVAYNFFSNTLQHVFVVSGKLERMLEVTLHWQLKLTLFLVHLYLISSS